MSIEVYGWEKFEQRYDSCMLASLGLAVAPFTSLGPDALFESYCHIHAQNILEPPEKMAVKLFDLEMQQRGVSGYGLLKLLVDLGQGEFGTIKKSCDVDPYKGSLSDLERRLTSESATATICLNFGDGRVHSVAIAVGSNGSVWRNDPNPNKGLTRMARPWEKSIWQGYESVPNPSFGDSLVVTAKPHAIPVIAPFVGGSVSPD